MLILEYLGLLLLLIILFIGWGLKYIDCDIWSPINLCLLFWGISIISTMYLLPIIYLKIDEMLFLIIFLGISGLFIGYFFIKTVKINKNFIEMYNCCLEAKNEKITNIFFLILTIIIFLISVDYYISQIGLIATVGVEVNEALNSYRMAYLNGEIQIPFYVRQCNKLLIVLAYISVYNLASKIILKKGPLYTSISIIVLILFMIGTVVQAARTNIVHVMIGFMIYISIFFIKKYRKGLSLKINIKILFLGGIFVIFFGFLGQVMGRGNQFDIFETISFYFGSGIIGLNQALKNSNYYIPHFWGDGTFSGIWRCINDYIIDINYTYTQPFSNLNGLSIGNTFTGFYRYYCDFGIVGVIIITFCIGYFLNRFYNYVINKNCSYMAFILYGYFIHGIVLLSYDENLLSAQLSFALINDIIYIYLIRLMFFKKRNKIYE